MYLVTNSCDAQAISLFNNFLGDSVFIFYIFALLKQLI